VLTYALFPKPITVLIKNWVFVDELIEDIAEIPGWTLDKIVRTEQLTPGTLMLLKSSKLLYHFNLPLSPILGSWRGLINSALLKFSA
jgi:hypothetical protein